MKMRNYLLIHYSLATLYVLNIFLHVSMHGVIQFCDVYNSAPMCRNLVIPTQSDSRLKFKLKSYNAPRNKVFFCNILASLVTCPPPSGMRCYWEPEDTCTDHSDCQYLSADGWIGLCCPHICKGKSVCRDIRCKYI